MNNYTSAMATPVVNASRNVVRRRPVAMWTTVAGGK